MTNILGVYIEKRQIGTLTLLSGESSFFAFEESYLNDPERPVLSQSFFSPSGDIITEMKATRVKLPPFFSNLLPEGPLRTYLAERGGIKPAREFKLLELLGEDLPGAVIVRPLEGIVTAHTETEYKERNNNEKPYRFSLAGVQLKFSGIAGKNGGLTIPAGGIGGDWIIKLPAQNFTHVPENEWAMLHLAAEIGIPVPDARLVDLQQIAGLPEMGILVGSKALAVKRFDRGKKGKRIHIEDFAQVYGIFPDDKYTGVSYANIANMVWTLTGESGLKDFIRRLTFCILIGNGDMHLKNWSFLYTDPRKPTLSPAYDLVSTIPYIPSDGLALTLSDTKNMVIITLAHFEKLARKAKIPEYLVLETVRETVAATLAAWSAHMKNYGLPIEIVEHIERHMKRLMLARKGI